MYSNVGHGVRTELFETAAGFLAGEPGGGRTSVAVAISSSLSCQRFKTRDNIEELLIDTVLPQSMKRAIEVLQQFVDILVGALHGRKPARVFGRERFGARTKYRHEEVSADECPQGFSAAATDDLGQTFRRPGKFGKIASPLFIER